MIRLMNYFTELTERCSLLDERGREYLDTLPFMSNQDVVKAIWNFLNEKHLPDNKEYKDLDWNKLNELEAQIYDSGVPFSSIPKNGSLKFSMGFSVVAWEAKLRNVYEHLVNGAQILDLPGVADIEFTDDEKMIEERPKYYLTLTFRSAW